MKRTVDVCLVSGLVGIMLGSLPFAIARLKGYELTKSESPGSGASAQGPGSCGQPPAICPMTGGPRPGTVSKPRPKRDLTTLVQKLNLLTGDIGITLTAEQAAAVNACLGDVEKSAPMSDDDAKAKHDQLLAVLNENQKARLAAIELPQPASSGGPGMMWPTTGKPKPAMPGMMAGGPPVWEDANENPFQQAAAGKALKSLHERLASQATAAATEASKAPPAPTEAPDAPPTKAETSKAQPPEADASTSPAATP